jgi:hypothetical protein
MELSIPIFVYIEMTTELAQYESRMSSVGKLWKYSEHHVWEVMLSVKTSGICINYSGIAIAWITSFLTHGIAYASSLLPRILFAIWYLVFRVPLWSVRTPLTSALCNCYNTADVVASYVVWSHRRILLYVNDLQVYIIILLTSIYKQSFRALLNV